MNQLKGDVYLRNKAFYRTITAFSRKSSFTTVVKFLNIIDLYI